MDMMKNETSIGIGKSTVFHDVRQGDKIFLCIETPDDIHEAAKLRYSVERELSADDCTPESIMSLIREMEIESGLSLAPSDILRDELGM